MDSLLWITLSDKGEVFKLCEREYWGTTVICTRLWNKLALTLGWGTTGAHLWLQRSLLPLTYCCQLEWCKRSLSWLSCVPLWVISNPDEISFGLHYILTLYLKVERTPEREFQGQMIVRDCLRCQSSRWESGKIYPTNGVLASGLSPTLPPLTDIEGLDSPYWKITCS